MLLTILFCDSLPFTLFITCHLSDLLSVIVPKKHQLLESAKPGKSEQRNFCNSPKYTKKLLKKSGNPVKALQVCVVQKLACGQAELQGCIKVSVLAPFCSSQTYLTHIFNY